MKKTVSVYEISKVIGESNTKTLIDNFGGMTCYFSTDPMAIKYSDKPERNQVIKNLFFDSGLSVNEISKRMNLSSDHVRKIINKH